MTLLNWGGVDGVGWGGGVGEGELFPSFLFFIGAMRSEFFLFIFLLPLLSLL